METPVAQFTEAKAIIDSYLVRAEGNPSVALRLVVRDALADLSEAERRLNRQSRLVSSGYARDALARR